MHLHVIAGARALLQPSHIDGAELARLIGPEARMATASWLSKRCGKYDHDFLLERGDDRIAVFAQALQDNFGSRCSPVIVLPDLLEEIAGTQAGQSDRRGSLEALSEVLRLCLGSRSTLHAIALPAAVVAAGDAESVGVSGLERLLAPWVNGRLDGMRAAFAANGCATEHTGTNLIEVRPEQPVSDMLLRNALAQQLVSRISARLAKAHLRAGPEALRTATVRILERWSRDGILPVTPIGSADLDRLADRIATVLLQEGANG